MRMVLSTILVVATLTAVAGEYPYPLGPCSRLAKYPEGALWNGFCAVQVERGFKLHALVPMRRDDALFGRMDFGGFLTLRTSTGPLYERFAQTGDGTRTIRCGPRYAQVAKESEGWSQTIAVSHGSPFVWLGAQVPPTQATATWLLMGWDWARMQPPDDVRYVDAAGQVAQVTLAPGGADPLPDGADLGGPLVVLRQRAAPFVLALVFPHRPSGLHWQNGAIAIETAATDGTGAPFAAAVLPVDMTWEQMAALMPYALFEPQEQRQAFKVVEGRPQVTFGCGGQGVSNDWGIAPQSFVTLPPSVAEDAPPGTLKLATLHGTIALCPGTEVTVKLPPVPHLEELRAPVVELPEKWRERMNSYTQELVAHQRSSGAFDFSMGRPFYDGLTLCSLTEARPYLTPDLRAKADAAIRKGLSLWWDSVRLDGETGLWYFPEPAPTRPVVDYPEITATLLWPMALYGTEVDPQYVRDHAVQVRRLAATLPLAHDFSGAAFAYPGPEFNHIIVESVVGGFMGWVAMHHLAKLIGDETLAEGSAARAALAKKAMVLLREREELGTEGIVNELMPDRVKTSIHDAWCYTMYTWFSFVPSFELSREDEYGLWRTLEARKWWEYTLTSRQRCYDYAHLMALARYRSPQEAQAHLAQVDDRPMSHEFFDFTEAYALLAYPWLAAMGVR